MNFKRFFFSKFFCLSCFFALQVAFSQTKEEKKAFESEAQRLFRKDIKKSIKLYEYLIENSAEQDKPNYEINMVKLKLFDSQNIEAIDLMFKVEKNIVKLHNRPLLNKFYRLKADVFYYLGFKKESDSIQKHFISSTPQ